jgi:hypothetical protein
MYFSGFGKKRAALKDVEKAHFSNRHIRLEKVIAVVVNVGTYDSEFVIIVSCMAFYLWITSGMFIIFTD